MTGADRIKRHRDTNRENGANLGGMTITSPKAVASFRRLKKLYGTKGAIEFALIEWAKPADRSSESP